MNRVKTRSRVHVNRLVEVLDCGNMCKGVVGMRDGGKSSNVMYSSTDIMRKYSTQPRPPSSPTRQRQG